MQPPSPTAVPDVAHATHTGGTPVPGGPAAAGGLQDLSPRCIQPRRAYYCSGPSARSPRESEHPSGSRLQARGILTIPDVKCLGEKVPYPLSLSSLY